MKIVFTGGGSGGHFYPIIAIAEQIAEVAAERNLLPPQLFYIAGEPFDEKMLYENDIQFFPAPAGKMRVDNSPLNFLSGIQTAIGTLKTLPKLFSIYPDVVFSKGGYESVPTLFAARIWRIPVMIHDSDAVPGRANLWASKFAERIAVSYPQAAEYFPKPEEAVYTGNPVRKELMKVARHGAHEFLGLSPELPTVLIIGGSQGATTLNDAILKSLSELVEHFQIIHQTGEKNLAEVKSVAAIALEKSQYGLRYKPFGYLNDLAMKMAAGAADLIISRAGSGAIFEISEWEKPSILIPIPEEVSRDQRTNAFAYARSGGAIVIEQQNLTPHLLVSEINRIIGNKSVREQMAEGARHFKKPDAARVIAEELIALALEHER